MDFLAITFPIILASNFLNLFKSESNFFESFSGQAINNPPDVCASARINFSNDLIVELKAIYKENGLTDDETFELQQHLLSNIDKLEEPERNLLRDLSQKTN